MRRCQEGVRPNRGSGAARSVAGAVVIIVERYDPVTGLVALGSGKFGRYPEARDGEKNGDEDRGQDTSHIGFLRPLYPEHYGALPGSFRILSSGSNLFVLYAG